MSEETLATVAGEEPTKTVWQREQSGGHEPNLVGPGGPWSRLNFIPSVSGETIGEF